MFASERFIKEIVQIPKTAAAVGTGLGLGAMFVASLPVAVGAGLAVPAGSYISSKGDEMLRDRANRGVADNAAGTISALNKQLQNKNFDMSRKNLKVLKNTLSPQQFKNSAAYNKMMSNINYRIGSKNLLHGGAAALGLGAAGLAAYKLYKNRKRKQEEKELQNFNKTNIEQ